MQTSLLTSYSCAKQQFRGAGTSVILHDGRYGAWPKAKTCYRHQQTSSSDLPNPRNILIWIGLCRRSPCRPCGSGGDWSKSVSWHSSVLYPTRPDVHTTYLVASNQRVWGCCESRSVRLREGLRSHQPHPACAQRFRPINPLRCCPLGGRLLNFLTQRQQRVNSSADCFSDCGLVPAGVPQGTNKAHGYSSGFPVWTHGSTLMILLLLSWSC